jgi:hypothetical protein
VLIRPAVVLVHLDWQAARHGRREAGKRRASVRGHKPAI